MTDISTMLIGEECPECGGRIDGGTLRRGRLTWQHRSKNAMGGHHQFDVLDALDMHVERGFVPDRAEEMEDGVYYLSGAVVARHVPPTGGEEYPSLTFADEYVDAVIAGDKTMTVRYDVVDAFEPGDRVRAVTEDGEEFALLDITAMCKGPTGDALAWAEFMGIDHNTDSTRELVSGLNEHYPDADISVETVTTWYAFRCTRAGGVE